MDGHTCEEVVEKEVEGVNHARHVIEDIAPYADRAQPFTQEYPNRSRSSVNNNDTTTALGSLLLHPIVSHQATTGTPRRSNQRYRRILVQEVSCR